MSSHPGFISRFILFFWLPLSLLFQFIVSGFKIIHTQSPEKLSPYRQTDSKRPSSVKPAVEEECGQIPRVTIETVVVDGVVPVEGTWRSVGWSRRNKTHKACQQVCRNCSLV